MNEYEGFTDDPREATVEHARWESDATTRQWALMLHLSQFAGYIVPVAGMVAPLLIWQLKKDSLPGLDAHGRNVANWMISVIIYALCCIPLILALGLGVLLLVVLGILCVVFPIVGAIKAGDGEAWRYPFSISIF